MKVMKFSVNIALACADVKHVEGSGFEPHRRHCVVVLEQDTFILA